MSIREQIPLLEQLSKLDQELRKLDEQLTKERKEIEDREAEARTLDARIERDSATLRDMERTRNEMATELRQQASHMEQSRERLGRSRNERESQAAQREVEEVRKLQRDREGDISRLDVALGAARTSVADAVAKRAAVGEQLTALLAAASTGLPAERASLEEQRGVVTTQLPADLVRRYEVARQRRPVAVARAVNGTCNGCYLSLPPMLFQTLRKQDEFGTCPQCRRILFYVPPEVVVPPPGAEPEAPAAKAPKRKRAKPATDSGES